MPPKKPLTRERVLAAAVRIVDKEGLEALTMRRLGQALDVEAMSLYRHVPGRAALLDGIHETILAELAAPPRITNWIDAIRTQARAFRTVLTAHPNALVLFATRPAVTPASLRHVDAGIVILRRAGFSITDAIAAFQTIVTFVVGHVLSTHAVVPKEERSTPAYTDAKELRGLAEVLPHLADHDVDAEFEFGLDTILRGLEAKRPR
jgi:AcrR family transcriptional regulator